LCKLKIKRTYRLQAIALFLMALTLVGSIGVNADFHICQNKVKDIAILDLADGCSEMETMFSCAVTNANATAVEKAKCCSNEHIFAKASFENIQVMEDIHFESIAIPFFTSQVHLELHQGASTNYSEMPPTWRVSSGLHIAFQQFLI
jgi:hypothetical protein